VAVDEALRIYVGNLPQDPDVSPETIGTVTPMALTRSSPEYQYLYT
jgi:hypothetical protein